VGVPATQVIARDRHAEVLYACAALGTSIEQFALEVRHLARSEVGEAEEPFAEGQKGSSSMPHKRNPVISERLCGLARVLRGYLQAGLEDVALWHERDISHSSVERVVLPDALQLTVYMLRKATALADGLVLTRARAGEPHDGIARARLLPVGAAGPGGFGLSRDDAYRLVQAAARASRSAATSARSSRATTT
jgi:adenylosuccinate lyase